MKINKSLNLVSKVVSDDGTIMHVHSAPITLDLFDAHADVLEDTFSHYVVNQERLRLAARRSHKRMLSIAERMGKLDEVKNGLLPEVRRLTNVAMFAKGKWQDLGYQEVYDRQFLDPETLDEIEGRIAFFTAASHLFPRQERETWMTGALGLWGAQITSLDFTAYLNFLVTSTADASSGEKKAAA